VKNCPDGSVEIHAEGRKEKLEELVAWCHQGPLLASVANIDLNWIEAQGLSSFDIQ
jgi:acylphosphatase